MKSSEILRKAARKVERGTYRGGCIAIANSARGFNDISRAHKVFRRHFYRSTSSGYWWPFSDKHGPRIIGLCLAAAIAESEGD